MHPALKRAGGARLRAPEASLEEAVGLAAAIGLEVVESEVVRLNEFRPNTLLGKGKLDEYAGLINDMELDVVIVDAIVSPVQQRNLEQALKSKVIDRTGLILEIFGARARTREGTLQVELAHLNYQRSRLVRSWTHLERQRGGFGFLGGPGESQLEMDRRLIEERIIKIKGDLQTVVRTRNLHRRERKKSDHPTIALVGYTNAGKSTLFNRLTEADVLAKDMLFATLDPTMRSFRLPDGRQGVLSDTVGFIADLPTHLVAAFRATLEEVLEADLIVHVRDASHPDSDAQNADVRNVLGSLGIDVAERPNYLEVLNKIDLLPDDARTELAGKIERGEGVVPVSAVTGEGCAALLAEMAKRVGPDRRVVNLTLDLTDGAGIAWLYQHGQVVSREDRDGQAHLKVGLGTADLGRFQRQHPAVH